MEEREGAEREREREREQNDMVLEGVALYGGVVSWIEIHDSSLPVICQQGQTKEAACCPSFLGFFSYKKK
jgi:hypothetical protein